jgi:hypothetical protein
MFWDIQRKKEATAGQVRVRGELGWVGEAVDALAWIQSELGSGIFQYEAVVCRGNLYGHILDEGVVIWAPVMRDIDRLQEPKHRLQKLWISVLSRYVYSTAGER